MRDLDEMAVKLLETASKLPPGPERHEFLKEIGTFRARIAIITAKQEQSQSAKEGRFSWRPLSLPEQIPDQRRAPRSTACT